MTDDSNPSTKFGAAFEKRLFSLIALRGRFGRKQFWLGSLGLLGCMMLMIIPLAAMSNPTGGSNGPATLLTMSIPFVWLYSALMVLRLHDLGWSGRWYALLGPLLILLPYFMYRESHDVYFRIEQSGAAQQAIKNYVMFMEFGAFALFLGGFILMGCLRGTMGPNKYGPDPRASRAMTEA